MKKILILFCVCVSLMADIYEELSDYAYKKNSENFKSKKVELLSFYKDGKKCVDLLLSSKNIRVLESFYSCKNLEKDINFENFLNKEFLMLYQSDMSELDKEMQHLKQLMRDIMVYYKLYHRLDKDMVKNSAVEFLKLEKYEANLLFRINKQACVGIEIFKEKNKMAMKIYGIENLDKACNFFISSPFFKELSYTNKAFRLYYLE